jgi:UDP-3-O-acyl-N-acetylglucosamine deacetylase
MGTMSDTRVTVGTVTHGDSSLHTIYVDGEEISAVNSGGIPLHDGQSVTLLRMKNGRFQILGLSGYQAPQPE